MGRLTLRWERERTARRMTTMDDPKLFEQIVFAGFGGVSIFIIEQNYAIDRYD